MNYTYAMGVSENIEKLKKEGFITETANDDYKVSFPYGKEEVWEKYIIENLSNGYWNEYIGKNLVFIFKFEDGNTKKYILDSSNKDEILELCSKFAETTFLSIEELIYSNDFYKEKIATIPKF